MSFDPQTGGHHVIPPRVYLATFGALILLTIVTVLAAVFEFGQLNIVVALAIAVTKAMLVVLFFMGVRWYGQFLKVVAAAGFVWFGIMVLFTMSDYLSRNWAGVDAPQGVIIPAVDDELVPNVPAGQETAAPNVPTGVASPSVRATGVPTVQPPPGAQEGEATPAAP